MIKNKYDLVRDDLFKEHSSVNIIKKIDRANRIDQNRLLRILILDGYKLKYHDKITKGIELPELYNQDIKKIIKECLNDYNSLVQIINDANEIYNLDFVTKCILMEEYAKNGLNPVLVNIDKSFLLDILTYSININLDDYKEYYIEYLKNEPEQSKPILSSSISTLLAYKTQELYKTDDIKYTIITLECLKRYYKWMNYIECTQGTINAKHQYYMSLIEKEDLDEVVSNLLMDTEEYKDILEAYLQLSTQNIDEKEVDDCYKKSVSGRIKEKLK